MVRIWKSLVATCLLACLGALVWMAGTVLATDPNNSQDPGANNTVEVQIIAGDDSGSNSEEYDVVVYPKGSKRRWWVGLSSEAGQQASGTVKLVKGNAYDMRLRHKSGLGDFDYTWTVGGVGLRQTGELGPLSGRETWFATGEIIVHDPDTVLGTYGNGDGDPDETVPFYAQSRKITVYVPKVELKSVEFTSDHNLLKKNPTAGSEWGDSSTAYETPEWVAGSRNNPITQTKNTRISATVTVKVEPSGMNFDLIGDAWPDEYVEFHKTGEMSTGSDQGIAVTADANLPDEVCVLDKSINWAINVRSLECSAGSSGSHKIYVTYGTPAGSAVTERRVQEVCTIAGGQSSFGGCADSVYGGLNGSFDLGASMWGPSPIWLLHDMGEESQCPGLADYVNKHLQMLGLGTGEIRFCHAKPDGTFEASSVPVSTSRTIVPGAEHSAPTTHDDYDTSEALIHWDGSTPPGANNYEATCFFNSKHYALGVGAFSTAKNVANASFTAISWEYVASNSTPPPPYIWQTCTEAPWIEAP